jgi:hypothetical protein
VILYPVFQAKKHCRQFNICQFNSRSHRLLAWHHLIGYHWARLDHELCRSSLNNHSIIVFRNRNHEYDHSRSSS